MNSRNMSPPSSPASFSPGTTFNCAPPILLEISLNSLKRFACSSGESASWVRSPVTITSSGRFFSPLIVATACSNAVSLDDDDEEDQNQIQGAAATSIHAPEITSGDPE